MAKPPFSRFLLFISVGMFFLLLAQVYYLNKLVGLQKVDFNKQINNTLESSLAAERKWRTDSLCNSLRRWIKDSSLTKVYSRLNKADNKMNYIVEDVGRFDPQSANFSLDFENRPIMGPDDPVKQLVIEQVVSSFRQSYLSYQSIFYYTKTLGDSADALNHVLRLDTLTFKNILSKQLLSKGITTPFKLRYLLESDTISQAKHTLLAAGPFSLQTRLFRSDLYNNSDRKLVFASFDNPSPWLFRALFWPLAISFLLFILIAALFFYFYKTLAQQKKLAELKDDFVDNMTHELKTPISIISAAAEALQDFGFNKDPEKSGKYLSNIRGQAKQLNNIVSKVLAMSTSDKEEIKLSPSNFSLNELLGEIKEGISPFLENRAFSIFLPETDMRITADRFHLKNVLFNVIDNAVKYNDKERVQIEVAYQSTAHWQSIVVTDNGCGIPLEHIEQVFNKFHRVPTGNIQKTRGFGLGLFYVKKMMDAHNGQVKIESVQGKQTTILLTFPKL